MPAELTFHSDPNVLASCQQLIFIGRKRFLLSDGVARLAPDVGDGLYGRMVKSIDPGDDGRTTSTWVADSETPSKLIVAVLPEVCSRHNTPTRAWAIPRVLAAASRRRPLGIVVALEDDSHACAIAAAIGRAFPTFTSSSNKPTSQRVRAVLVGPNGPVSDTGVLHSYASAVRHAAALVDRPPNDLTTTAFVAHALEVARSVGASVMTIEGENLREQGIGGIYGVGKASEHPPALVVLDYDPPGAKTSMAWVGKGIVYDTGGLSLKTKTGMVNMKNDMGGAAAVIAAFRAAVQQRADVRLTAVLCIAENAIGPRAIRPDDVLAMYSGRTVEVNNTDAEGRLVLADGLSWVHRHRSPDILIDCATLTGAQSVATGKAHAALYCNDDALEARAIDVGKATGDLVHALPFAPEFFRKEFGSAIADMRNSVKNRANAQSSCAGQFLLNHLADRTEPWLHIDLAGPAWNGSRGTGFGAALLLGLTGVGLD